MHMDKMEFIAALTMAYKGKDPEKKDAYQKSIGYFADECPEIHLSQVYSYAMTEKFKSADKMYTFAKEQGFITKAERVHKAIKYYYKCNGFFKKVVIGQDKDGKDVMKRKKFDCNTKYSANSGGCPNCGSTSGTVVVDEKEVGFSNEIKIVQAKCFICSRYSLEIKSRKPYIHGPECGTHGNYNSPEGVEYCRSCKCKDCCIDARDEKFHRDNYYFQKNGDRQDIKQPWLKSSRNPGDHIFDFEKVTLNKKSIIKGV